MAFRELHVVEMKETLRLWSKGHGFRAVARTVGVDRKTVKRYVEAACEAGLERGEEVDDAVLSAEAAAIRPGAPPEVGCMRKHLREHAELLQNWAQEGCQGPKLVKLLKRSTGVAVPLRTMQRFLADDLDLGRETDTVRVVDPPAGVLEVDFMELGLFRPMGSDKPRKMFALVCTAGLSRHQFVWPCLGQTQEDLIEGLEAAWEFFGGVFPILLPDNLKAVVTTADAVSPRFSTDFLEYAQARGFEIDPARVRKPRDKARVERQVRYVRGNFWTGEDFRSVEQARDAARVWCLEDAGMRVHGRTRRRPLEAFEADEKPELLPAPTEPYDQPRWSKHTVDRSHAVVVGHALYSVPHQLGKCVLKVRSDKTTVKLYLKGKLVKCHPRQPEGGTWLDPVDLPPYKADLATRDATPLCERAVHHGPHIGEYARLLAEGPLPWTRLRHVHRLLGLADRFGSHATDEACARALGAEVVDVNCVQRMLERGLVRRRLLKSAPPPVAPAGRVLRFQRPSSAFRRPGKGGSDAPA